MIPVKEIVWGAIGAALIVGVVDLLSVGSWLNSRSDALWWDVLPWVLIAVVWFVMMKMWRKHPSGWTRGR